MAGMAMIRGAGVGVGSLVSTSSPLPSLMVKNELPRSWKGRLRRRGGSCEMRLVSVLSSEFRGRRLGFQFRSEVNSQRRGHLLLSSPQAALVQKVSAKELDALLSHERTSPMIIDFYATWCGPCILLAQQLETLAVEFGDDVRFLKVDTDEEHELASQLEIRGLPTMVFLSKDVEKLAIRTEGLLPTEVIRNIIEKEL